MKVIERRILKLEAHAHHRTFDVLGCLQYLGMKAGVGVSIDETVCNFPVIGVGVCEPMGDGDFSEEECETFRKHLMQKRIDVSALTPETVDAALYELVTPIAVLSHEMSLDEL